MACQVSAWAWTHVVPLGGRHTGCKAAEGAADGDAGPPRDVHGPRAQPVSAGPEADGAPIFRRPGALSPSPGGGSQGGETSACGGWCGEGADRGPSPCSCEPGSLAGFCGALQEERGGSSVSGASKCRWRPLGGSVCGRPVPEAATAGQSEGAGLRGGRVRRLRRSAGLSPHGGAAPGQQGGPW